MRARVMAAIDELGYRVNLQARFLASKSQRIVVLICAIDDQQEPNSYYQSALEIGALRACASLGLELATHSILQDSPHSNQHILDIVMETACAGVVLTPPFSDRIDLIRALQARGENLACISPGDPEAGAQLTVGMDDEAAGHAIGQYLIARGHKRIGFISGPEAHRSASKRYDGVLRAMREADLGEESLTLARGNFTFKSGIAAFPELLRNRPTAIICANDDMAVGALFAAHEAGISVPDEISLASFDDTPVSALVWPPITTVRQPIKQIAGRAIELLASSEDRSERVAHEYQPFTIVERASVATIA